MAAAAHRAAHQLLDDGWIFSDSLAVRILGEDPAEVARAGEEPGRRAMRIFIAARTRSAEDALAAAVADGVGQLVVLGAGLDTYAYRGAFRDRLRIFEVDHPATQAWKRERLQAAGIAAPDSLTFAPVDFERETLADGLSSGGFDLTQPSFFTWLGVVPYLREEAIWSTLGYIAALPGVARVVFDYGEPPDSLPPGMRERYEKRAARVAEFGEPFLSFFEPGALRNELLARGFSRVDDWGPRRIAQRFFPARAAFAPDRGGHIVLATRI